MAAAFTVRCQGGTALRIRTTTWSWSSLTLTLSINVVMLMFLSMIWSSIARISHGSTIRISIICWLQTLRNSSRNDVSTLGCASKHFSVGSLSWFFQFCPFSLWTSCTFQLSMTQTCLWSYSQVNWMSVSPMTGILRTGQYSTRKTNSGVLMDWQCQWQFPSSHLLLDVHLKILQRKWTQVTKPGNSNNTCMDLGLCFSDIPCQQNTGGTNVS